MATNTISLQTAQTWARNWRNHPDPSVIACLIPAADLQQLLHASENSDVRAYFGVDDDGHVRLMLVSVDSKGIDMIDEQAGYYIYDHTGMCPTICDVSSPIYNF